MESVERSRWSQVVGAFARWGWAFSWGIAAVAVAACITAGATGGELRAVNPCVNAYDNFWTWASLVLVGLGVALSVLDTVANRIIGDAFEIESGVIRSVLMFVALSAVWILVALGGYGWYCLE